MAARNSKQSPVTTTQSVGEAAMGLDRIRQAAKRNKTMRFDNLLHHLTPKLLHSAYFALNRKAVCGVDDVTWQAYGGINLPSKLEALHQQIHAGRYRPLPSKRIWIEKDNGSLRPIGIASLEDKIVQQALVWILQEIYETEFKGFSYGFRPGRSQHHALDAVYMMLTTKKVSWVLDADIKGCYDNIDHEWLMLFLSERIADKRVLELCVRMLHAGIQENGAKEKTLQGVPQGAVNSPFFANIFLHYVLDLWVDGWRKRNARGDCYIVRYADDFVIGFQYRSDGEALHKALGSRLENFGLSLHEDKTQLVEFGRFAITNRKERGERKPEALNFLGFTHLCSEKRSDKSFTVRRVTQKSKLHKKIREVRRNLMKVRETPLKFQIQWVRSLILGYQNYYGVPGNFHALSQFRKEVCLAWYKALRCRSNKARKLSWIKMRKFIKSVVPTMRTVHPYPSQRFGV